MMVKDKSLKPKSNLLNRNKSSNDFQDFPEGQMETKVKKKRKRVTSEVSYTLFFYEELHLGSHFFQIILLNETLIYKMTF